MENSYCRATTLSPSLCTYPCSPPPFRSPHYVVVRYLCTSPTLLQNSLPPPLAQWYRMCGNVATVKYIRTNRRGTKGGMRKNWQRVLHSNLDGTRSASRFTSAQNSRKRGPRENCVYVYNERGNRLNCLRFFSFSFLVLIGRVSMSISPPLSSTTTTK